MKSMRICFRRLVNSNLEEFINKNDEGSKNVLINNKQSKRDKGRDQ